ncbi:glutamate-5-semialdehyde dehydrogenase [Klugiella xanthotipulae]|uniref:Gamma-glutamyl phosphate reductase n=1 Tax=Klugiella xanthotipulae TaxID=244735 RepID=A0A543HSE3_9MICO|nr:glutamate-5-semialdehyde dehydrogenase [Klugiella xanthotipulae]TQM61240.1 glutamate-5-semialdehyde dehydrogenase [Klugiella xanthotipulae]
MLSTSLVAQACAEKFLAAKVSGRRLAIATTEQKDAALTAMAELLRARSEDIVRANARDCDVGAQSGLSAGLQDRLRLDAARVESLAEAVLAIRALPDPVGQVVRGSTLPNGIRIVQTRVPFGVVGSIYEARPNVTIDIAALALKSGNSVILRGGSAAEQTNAVLVALVRDALVGVGLPAGAVQSVDEFGRAGAQELMRAREYVDVLVPRGSARLIRAVVADSTVPVLETGAGVVHIYVEATADVPMAVEIVVNAKVQRPSVCNAVETVLVDAAVAATFLPVLGERLTALSVDIRGCDITRSFLPGAGIATDDDWATEYGDLIVAVRVVAGLDAAMQHIERYSTGHTESIITRDIARSERFLAEVDSAVVMVNASTRFTDGGEFGFGAEVGISTQKLHARGPMGLPELTSTKWIVRGNGQVRPG